MINYFTLLITKFAIFFILIGESNAAIYYIASAGNDNNSGLNQATPWQTISKVNSMMTSFQPGDQILFNKGDRFSGEVIVSRSGAPGNELVFGSYGTGAAPLITGKKNISGWSVHSGNVYKANFNDTISHLYVNGKLMTIARFPNSGWLKIDMGVANNGFYDADLTQGVGYWNSANCRVRTTNWAYETRVVSAFASGSVTFANPSQWQISPNYGYYFDNKLSLLDAEGEWFHDKTAGVVYLYSPGGVNPNTVSAEAVIYKNGFTLIPISNYVTIRDLNISGFNTGVVSEYGVNTVVQNCLITHTNKFGINLSGNGILIENNFFEDNLNVGITGNMNSSYVTNNTFNRTGAKAGYGQDGFGYIALYLELCDNTSVNHNNIDSTGYTAIRAGRNMILEKNVINYSCITLNDGGGIAFDIADGLQIKNNIITNGIGNIESSSSSIPLAMGIYFGGGYGLIRNILIQGNTIASNRYTGIHVDNTNTSHNYQIINNVLYNNFPSQIVFTDFSSTSFTPNYNHTIKGNIFYSLSWTNYCLEQIMYHSSSFSDFGHFDSNYYCNPYNEFIVKRTSVQPVYSTKQFRLITWKNEAGEDLNSKYSQFSFDQFKVTDTLSSNLILNSKFTTGINGWTTWPPVGSTIAHTTHSLLDTGCLRMRWNGTGFTESFTTGNTFSVVQGNYYLVSLSSVGNHTGEFKVLGMPRLPDLWEYGLNRIFGYENFKKTCSYIFKSDLDAPSSKLSVGLTLPDSLLYIDNVNLYHVNVQRVDSTELSKLFTNQTNSVQSFPLQGISYKDLNGNPVTGSLVLQPYSSAILINDNSPSSSPKTLQLSVFIEGLFNTATGLTTRDTVTVYLRNIFSPYSAVDSAKSYLNTDGNATLVFNNVQNNINYYIQIKHRNSIETWSKNGGEIFSSSMLTYNFTTSSAQAFGNNLILKGSKYCIYSGDVNQDGIVDAGDLALIDNAVSVALSGYHREDLNNDQFVDATDLSICDNNVFNSISVIRP